MTTDHRTKDVCEYVKKNAVRRRVCRNGMEKEYGNRVQNVYGEKTERVGLYVRHRSMQNKGKLLLVKKAKGKKD